MLARYSWWSSQNQRKIRRGSGQNVPSANSQWISFLGGKIGGPQRPQANEYFCQKIRRAGDRRLRFCNLTIKGQRNVYWHCGLTLLYGSISAISQYSQPSEWYLGLRYDLSWNASRFHPMEIQKIDRFVSLDLKFWFSKVHSRKHY